MITLTGIGPSVVLRNPDFGDSWDQDLNNTINTSVDGTKTFFKGTRPTYYKYTLTFKPVTEAVKNTFKAFLIANAGDYINLVVTRNNITQSDPNPSPATTTLPAIPGFILSDNHQIDTLKDGCSYQITFTFEQTATDTPILLEYLKECV